MKKDLNVLLEQYKPLILKTYGHYHPMLNKKQDKEDLMSEINITFINLVREFDPKRGIDFPYYIKRMLRLRVYHYITKQFKVTNRESLIEGLTNDEITMEKQLQYTPEQFEEVLNVLSWDGEIHLGKKQEETFIGLLQGKSIKQLAEEEGVNITNIHSRVHAIIKKLEKKHELENQMELF